MAIFKRGNGESGNGECRRIFKTENIGESLKEGILDWEIFAVK